MSAEWVILNLQIRGQASLVSKTANVYDTKLHILVLNLTLDIDKLRSIVLYIHVYPKTHFKTTILG